MKVICNPNGIPICLHEIHNSIMLSGTNFLEEILKRLETWLAELEVLLDRRIERRGVLRGVSELSSLMCGLVS